MTYFVIGKFGYEDEFCEEFCEEFETLDDVENFIVNKTEENELCGTGFCVSHIIAGHTVDFKIVKKKTQIVFG